MPEQLTKHPEVTLQVLRSSGAKCGEGAPQEILTKCPSNRCCKLPGGEVCVYGLPEAPQMTQISSTEWQAVAPQPIGQTSYGISATALVLVVVASLAAGAAAGSFLTKRRQRQAGL